MGLRIERIPTLSDNYSYLLICESTNDAALIDVPEAGPAIQRIEETGANLTKILNTHHHMDHCGANAALAQMYAAPVYAHSSDAGRIPAFSNGLDAGDTISVGQNTARIFYIPSHTSGHIAYVFDEAQAVFTGDMLFAGGCGRLFEGDAQMMYNALCEQLFALPDDTRVFCGHEYTQSNLEFAITIEPDNSDMRDRLKQVCEVRARAASDWHAATSDEMTIPSTIGLEKATNPFMRASSAQDLGRIRTLKDNF